MRLDGKLSTWPPATTVPAVEHRPLAGYMESLPAANEYCAWEMVSAVGTTKTRSSSTRQQQQSVEPLPEPESEPEQQQLAQQRSGAESTAAASAAASSTRKILVLWVYHGLANRLRTVAAVAALAADLGRELHLHWPVNDQCMAGWGDLFAEPVLRVDTPEVAQLLSGGTAGARCLSGWSCYEPREGSGSALDRADLATLPTDGARVAMLRCAKCIASLRGPPETAEQDDCSARSAFYQVRFQPSTDKSHVQLGKGAN